VNTHKNARLTYARRVELARRASVPRANQSALARTFGVSRQTVHKWLARYRAEGERGLADRSSRPRRLARRRPRHQHRQIVRARRRHWSSVRIARHYRLPVSTVVTALRRRGLNRLARLEPPRPVVRYEAARPGQLVHLDIKKLGRIGRIGHRITGWRTGAARTRGIGWEYVHVAIDDCTRLAYAEVLADQQGPTAAAFLTRAVMWFAAQGIVVTAVLSDNGGCYRSRGHRAVVTAHGLVHRFTRPYRPQTNGKAERFIRTLLAEWAYAQAYRTSAWRTAALPRYLTHYNGARPHGALGYSTPRARLAERL
jgi:transposase InsO family protein